MDISTAISIASFLGLGTLLGAFYKMVGNNLKKANAKSIALELGVQAMLRDRIYQLYRYCNEKGYASLAERENFENMYQQYHNLGANGVMDDYHKKFFELPTE